MMRVGDIFSERNSWRFQVAVAIIVLILVLVAIFLEPLRAFYEVADLKMRPDAQKAFQFGERHFSSKEPGAYNIELADYFFKKAQEMDATLPYLLHERARVAFIRGEFQSALVAINLQISNHGSSTPNSYYIRGLILGYMGRYEEAAKDYNRFLAYEPHNWAGLNDYAWVLIKAKRYNEAAGVAAYGLQDSPDNPWLLNSYAIASSELGHHGEAQEAISRAALTVGAVTSDDWLTAYPGNDPQIAPHGITTLKQSIADNMRDIEAGGEKEGVQ